MKILSVTFIAFCALLSACSQETEQTGASKDAAAAAGPVAVTRDNYPLVETHRQMAITQTNAGEVNVFDHKREVPKGDNQPVIRMNRDTLYSMAIVDTTKGAVVTLPDTGDRYMSLMYLDEHHRVYDMVYEPGDHEIPSHSDHMYALIRIGIRSGDAEDLAEIHQLQNKIKLSAGSSKTFVPLAYEQESYEKTHHGILESFRTSGLSDTEKMFGTADYVDPDRYLIGTAIGWGGATWKDNIYQFSMNFAGFDCQSTTFQDPKNTGGFWSVTVYDKAGFMFDDIANVNSEVAVANEDGSFTVHFGCDGEVNNIPIENDTGVWNAAMRHYTPSQAVIDGEIVSMQTITPATATPIIVTQDNFPQAYTNMRLGAILQNTGGVNKFFAMPVPSSVPEEQFVVRMNRDTPYSASVIDMTSDNVYVTVPKTDRYVTIQIVDENHETQPMIYGSGRHKITAKTDYAFVIVRALEGDIRHELAIEAGSATPFQVQEWDMESFHAVDEVGNADFSDGYDQSKAFGNSESGQTSYMNYVGVAGGWGGAMVEDNIYQTSGYFSADACYETTFPDPEARYFWSITVYNGDGRMFNDVANISSEMDPVQNADGTYTLRFGCEGQPNNIPVAEGNKTGKFNILMRHYGPGKQVSNGDDGYDATKLVHKVE